MRLAIVGSRVFEDYDLLCRWADFMVHGAKTIEIVSGGARGADSLARRYAGEHDVDYKEFPADWRRLGRRAGMIRNRQIVLRSDRVLAFWDGHSVGTRHTINLTAAMAKPVVVVTFKVSVAGKTPLLFE